MWREPIHKSIAERTASNMLDYAWTRHDFTWSDARRYLTGLPDAGGLNIGYEAVDRHAEGGRRDAVALRCLHRDGEVSDVTYAELARRTNRFANLLDGLGVGPGDRVFSLLGRVPDLYVTAMGTLKHTSVYSPLFAAFGSEPVRDRLRRGDAKVLVTSPELYLATVAPIRSELPALRHVLVTGDGPAPPGTSLLAAQLDTVDGRYAIPPTDPGQMALLHFTSGTTGRPKGALHVHEAVVAHRATARLGLDLRADDVFWSTADPGSVAGISYGVIAPLTIGATVIVDAGEFEPRHCYATLAEQGVTVWYTAPSVLRTLMARGAGPGAGYDLSALRHVASSGEPLPPEAVLWGSDALGHPVHDIWWQTETGAIMISNYLGVDIRPGSMGLPMPGIEIAVLRRGEDGRAMVVGGEVSPVDMPDVDGELALRPGWPSMFRGYLHDDEAYVRCFADGWYLTGDVVRRDADGYVWFVGRADDVIRSDGHLIGTFEVESVLMEHPAVAEAGVIGKPDPIAGEVVKAFVSLGSGYRATDSTRLELLGYGRRRLGDGAPREIAFDQNIPHTCGGKVMRRLLRARELGRPEGDMSTLEA